jgi:hypothetical protein
VNDLPTTDNNNELLEYMKARDAQRQNRWIVGVVIAVFVAVVGWTAHNYMESQRETERFENERIDMFREAMNP